MMRGLIVTSRERMTNQEWKRRCAERILRAVKKAGRIRIRELKRATHYNRGPRDESIALWHDALEYLERSKAVAVEKDEYDAPVWIMTPETATALQAVRKIAKMDV